MAIKLSEHFTNEKLLRFTYPSILMMLFTSIYGIVDGFFVSNFVGKIPFAAINLIMPFLMICGAVGFIFGTGGSAIVAKTLGEGRKVLANKIFSLLIYFSIGLGILIAAAAIIFMPNIAATLGAEGEMLVDCVTYGRICALSIPAFILQWEFQDFFIAAEKPKLGFLVTVLAGVANMFLDFVLIAIFNFGLEGAAVATVISEFVAGFFPLFYFAQKNSGLLQLTKTSFDAEIIFQTCVNGSSEFVSSISMSLVGMIYNLQLLAYVGENGVAAYGVIMYVNLVFAAVFIGYSMGVAPVVSFHFGAKDFSELKNLLKRSFKLIGIFAICMLALAQIFALPLAKIFVGYDAELFNLTVCGFRIASFAYLFMGFAIFSSDFFTALNDGKTSAAISFLRTLVFEISAVLLLPIIFGVNGIWLSIVAAEFMAVVLSIIFLLKKRRQFHYL